jgi:hypothetical protein
LLRASINTRLSMTIPDLWLPKSTLDGRWPILWTFLNSFSMPFRWPFSVFRPIEAANLWLIRSNFG